MAGEHGEQREQQSSRHPVIQKHYFRHNHVEHLGFIRNLKTASCQLLEKPLTSLEFFFTAKAPRAKCFPVQVLGELLLQKCTLLHLHVEPFCKVGGFLEIFMYTQEADQQKQHCTSQPKQPEANKVCQFSSHSCEVSLLAVILIIYFYSGSPNPLKLKGGSFGQTLFLLQSPKLLQAFDTIQCMHTHCTSSIFNCIPNSPSKGNLDTPLRTQLLHTNNF